MALSPDYSRRVEEAVEELIDAGASPLWTGLAERFPEATDGGEPDGMPELREAFRHAAASWVTLNVDGSTDDAPRSPTSFVISALVVNLPDAEWLAKRFGDDEDLQALGVLTTPVRKRIHELAGLTSRHACKITLARDWQDDIVGILEGDDRFVELFGDRLSFTEDGRVGRAFGGDDLVDGYYDSFHLLGRAGVPTEEDLASRRREVSAAQEALRDSVARFDTPAEQRKHEAAVAEVRSRAATHEQDELDEALNGEQANAIGSAVAAVVSSGDHVRSVHAFIPSFEQCEAMGFDGTGREVASPLAFVDVEHTELADSGSRRLSATRYVVDRAGIIIGSGEPRGARSADSVTH